MDASVLQAPLQTTGSRQSHKVEIDMKLNFGHKIEEAVISLSWQVKGMSKAIQIMMNSTSGELPWRKTQNLIVTLSFCHGRNQINHRRP